MIPDDLWPRLSERFGLLPLHELLTPEQGGLTYGQWDAYITAVQEPPAHPMAVWLVEAPR